MFFDSCYPYNIILSMEVSAVKQRPVPLPYYHKPPMRFKNYEIHYNSDNALTHIQTNRHDYYEFYFLIAGAIDFYVEGVKYSLVPGDVMLIAPKQEHHSIITQNSPYERYVLWLDPGYISALSSPSTNLSLVFQKNFATSGHITTDSDMRQSVHRLLESLLVASQSKEYGSDLLTNSYVVELLVTLAQFRLFSLPTYPLDSSGSMAKPLIKSALAHINEHIRESISVQEIADALFVSRSYLSKVFREEMNIPLHQFITKKKLFLAKQELLGGASLKDVVENYNFGNYSSFYRAFKQEFGQAPKQIQTGRGLSPAKKKTAEARSLADEDEH